jgi:hypothetical protein
VMYDNLNIINSHTPQPSSNINISTTKHSLEVFLFYWKEHLLVELE